MSKRNFQLVAEFPISQIQGFFYERQIYDKDRLLELAEDIKQKGVLKNIVIAKELVSNDGKKVLGQNIVIAGFRTTKASMSIGLKTIPAKVYDRLTELEATDILLSENIHFEDMSDYDIAQNLLRYVKLGMNQKEIAKRINKSEAYVSQYLALLKDSEPIQKAIVKGEIAEPQARIIRKLPESLHQKAVELAKGKTVRETKQIVEKIAEENKAELIKKQIAEIEAKLKEIEKAEIEREQINNQIAKLEGQLNALKPSDMETKRLLAKLERLQTAYFPRKERLAQLKARKTEILKILPKQDVLEQLQKERKEIYEKLGNVQGQIKKLLEQLKELRAKEKELKQEAKRVTSRIEEITKLNHELNRIEREINDLQPEIKELEHNYAKEIKNFDKLKAELDKKQKDIVEQREAIMKQIAELKLKRNSLNGKIANKSIMEKRLADLKAQLRRLSKKPKK